MSQFTVSEPVPLRPDPDPNSSPIATLVPGDRIRDPVKLANWSKINATDAECNQKTGWILAQFLHEIVGQTVKLYGEPLSDKFELVTGTLDPFLELANWRKVRVTTDTGIRVGWIDMNATASEKPDMPIEPPIQMGDQLSLGVNEGFRQPLLKAQDITRVDAAALAALVDAEAAKITSGPDRGQWDPESFNPSSDAAGLTQFLPDTWKDHARNAITLLNKVAKDKGLVSATDGIVGSREPELLRLRFDPELSIVSAAEYGVSNLRALGDAGLIPEGIGDDDKARYMYLAHHEGPSGARLYLQHQNSASVDKFAAQVGASQAGKLTAAAGGDVALAYRRWFDGYMDENIRPAKFRTRGARPVIVAPETKLLAAFDGPPLPTAGFGDHVELVKEVQEALSRLGYLDPPADGKWGPTSRWSLSEFCKASALSLTMGFTRDIARALLSSAKTLPDIKLRGDWFDKVVAYMNRKGYWICRHPLATNVVYLEGLDPDGKVNDNRPNVFNDLRIVFAIDPSGRPALKSWEATTEPGTFWTMNPMNPGGAARIAFDQYKSWVVGTHLPGTASAHEALVQVAEVTVFRDLNKDFKRTGDETDTGLFGINQHWGYDAPKEDIGNTSAGCLVGRTKDGHREFMALLKADPRFVANRGYKFMTCVLPGNEVMA
jgi:hypothetical protein